MTEPAPRPSTEGIYRELRERIVLLDLEPGTRLTEEALATEFGVSRTPIREVLDRLRHERLVDQRPGDGTRVSIIDTKEVRDVWAVRLRIADLISEFVRVPADPEVLDRLHEIRTMLEEVRASHDHRALGALYNRYHDAVLDVFSNETLKRIHDQLYHQTARVWLQFLGEMDLDTEIDLMAEEVEQTIEALKDTSGARLSEIRGHYMRSLLDRFNLHVTRPIG